MRHDGPRRGGFETRQAHPDRAASGQFIIQAQTLQLSAQGPDGFVRVARRTGQVQEFPQAGVQVVQVDLRGGQGRS